MRVRHHASALLLALAGMSSGTHIVVVSQIGSAAQKQQALSASPAAIAAPMSRYHYRPADLIPGDWNHLNTLAQRSIADLEWPVIASALGLHP